jgi:hypothetical protein
MKDNSIVSYTDKLSIQASLISITVVMTSSSWKVSLRDRAHSSVRGIFESGEVLYIISIS